MKCNFVSIKTNQSNWYRFYSHFKFIYTYVYNFWRFYNSLYFRDASLCFTNKNSLSRMFRLFFFVVYIVFTLENFQSQSIYVSRKISLSTSLWHTQTKYKNVFAKYNIILWSGQIFYTKIKFLNVSKCIWSDGEYYLNKPSATTNVNS